MANSHSVFTWNLHQRTTRLDEQAGHVLAERPDVVCLQEVTPNALPRWVKHLEDADYNVVASTVEPGATHGRSLGVLTASRLPIERVEPKVVPWPERLVIAEVQVPGWSQKLHVVCLHAPLLEDPDEAMVRTLEAVHASLVEVADGVPAILIGDLNTPKSESRDGTSQPFAPTAKDRHVQAEQRILRGPDGWQDAFRTVNGFEADDCSYRGSSLGYRLDHVLISPNLTAEACAYDHDVRERGLSDHSAMYATIALSQDQPSAMAA